MKEQSTMYITDLIIHNNNVQGILLKLEPALMNNAKRKTFSTFLLD